MIVLEQTNGEKAVGGKDRTDRVSRDRVGLRKGGEEEKRRY